MLVGFLVSPMKPSSDLIERHAAERRIEFGALAELELVDHFDGEIARQNELRLAGHRFQIDRAAVAGVAVDVGAQKHIVAADHQHPRFAEIFRRDQHHHGEGEQRHRNGGAQDLAAVAPERSTKHGQVEVRIHQRTAGRRPGRLRGQTHVAAPTDGLNAGVCPRRITVDYGFHLVKATLSRPAADQGFVNARPLYADLTRSRDF